MVMNLFSDSLDFRFSQKKKKEKSKFFSMNYYVVNFRNYIQIMKFLCSFRYRIIQEIRLLIG